jgi:hypothetical protein
MNTILNPGLIHLDQVPGEQFLIPFLQKLVYFNISSKTVKKGKLLLFRRIHYHIQIALSTDKNKRENFEIPIPFNVENHGADGLLYFDYRLNSLNVENLPYISSKVSSNYFNKILEISIDRFSNQ